MDQVSSGRVRIVGVEDREYVDNMLTQIHESVTVFERRLRSFNWEPRRLTVMWRGKRFNLRMVR